MSVTVVVAPEAELQIRAIDTWWRENRPVAAELFIEELAEAVATLEAVPGIGGAVDHPSVKGLRRILLRATRVHLYYVADDATALDLQRQTRWAVSVSSDRACDMRSVDAPGRMLRARSRPDVQVRATVLFAPLTSASELGSVGRDRGCSARIAVS